MSGFAKYGQLSQNEYLRSATNILPSLKVNVARSTNCHWGYQKNSRSWRESDYEESCLNYLTGLNITQFCLVFNFVIALSHSTKIIHSSVRDVAFFFSFHIRYWPDITWKQVFIYLHSSTNTSNECNQVQGFKIQLFPIYNIARLAK